MSQLLYGLKRFALTIFGDIKIFKWPLFVIYQPTSFRIKGSDTRKIEWSLRPGDVVMRAYDDYLDGYFIPKGESGCSHSGLYIGDNTMVHSIAEGSNLIDIIDFCRTDKIIILRPDSGQEWAIEHAKKCADANIPYDFNFAPGPGKYYCHEFTASCYPHLQIETVSRKILGLFSSPKAFLADSFFVNKHFTKIYPPNITNSK
ncbi:MAG: YiiX/YebB-like N1pC/P60 family cysteine hydrolase [Pseudomonadota bacterium]